MLNETFPKKTFFDSVDKNYIFNESKVYNIHILFEQAGVDTKIIHHSKQN